MSLAGAVLVSAASVCAQEFPAPLRALFAEKMGIPADAPDFERRFDAQMSASSVSEETFRKSLADEFGQDPNTFQISDLDRILAASSGNSVVVSVVPQLIVKQYDFDDGKALNRPLSLPKIGVGESSTAESKKEQLKAPDFTEQIAAFNKYSESTIRFFTEPQPIPDCTAPSTLVDEPPPVSGPLDILVLGTQAPADSDELYGSKTQVYEFKAGQNSDSNSMLLALAEPECLPYRVRIYENRRYRYYGQHALRNFDGWSKGAGKNIQEKRGSRR